MATKSSKCELLDVLSEVKTRVQDKLGIVDFPMPQFILIGSQSVGKSRLVEAFAGEQFNFCSGTLGSRRPTVLEFRNIETAKESKWYVLDKATNQWQLHPTAEVMKLVGEAHNSLGNNISADPVHIRVESNSCVDMQVVDLPGYRSFAADAQAKQLADKIVELNSTFLQDPRNVVLCVEEAGDAANLSSLRVVQGFDPDYNRSILVRNKLDKYYSDLTVDNVNKWLEGFGDLPKSLTKFSLTLPHWTEGAPIPKPLHEMRTDMDEQDINKFTSLGVTKKHKEMVGFSNFAKYMDRRTERMFVEAINPVLTKLRELEAAMSRRSLELKDEMDGTDPTHMLATVRACGMSFANCLTHVMEGYIRSDSHRMTLDSELREFKRYHEQLGDSHAFVELPSEDFGSLDDYIAYLREYIKVPAFEVNVNGGAQFQRLMFEVETFLRFSEFGAETKKQDVLQSFGVSMGSVTWKEVIVKLLNHDAHIPLQKRITYVGERIKWFFVSQKEPVVQFMKDLKGSPDEKLYSVLYSKHALMLESNQTIRKLVFDTFDNVVDRQLASFLELFRSTLHATFSNPWVFLKQASGKLISDEEDPECLLPSLDDTKDRIKVEIQSRARTVKKVQLKLFEIPVEPHRIDEAVDHVQLLVLKVYSHIRSQVCDQVELFAESFFKLPLMRRLEEDMIKIELSDVDKEGYRVRRERLEVDEKANAHGLSEVRDCLKILQNFAIKSQATA